MKLLGPYQQLADPEATARLVERQRQALRDMGSKALCPHEYRPAVRVRFPEPQPAPDHGLRLVYSQTVQHHRNRRN